MGLYRIAVLFLNMLVVIFLVACTEKLDGNAGDTGTVEPLFALTADGVGPLNADTPFNLVQIGDAFQNYNVAQEARLQDGQQYPVITVRQHVKLLLSINANHRQEGVFSIITHDNLIDNKLGHRLGDRFNEIYSYEKTEECAPGLEEWSGKVMCYAPKTRNILYLFESESVQGKADIVPAPEAMADWQLVAIVWKPPVR